MRRTKIVCTLGPASERVEVLREMIRAGMDVARLNFSHGNHGEHINRIRAVREASKLENKAVAVMLDIKGPEVRVGEIEGDKIQLVKGQRIALTSRKCLGTAERISTTYENLPRDVRPGNTILLDDGIITLEVLRVFEDEVLCRVSNDGELGSHKGINVPGVDLSTPVVTEGDREDIILGIKEGVSFIAASFVKKDKDILEISSILREYDCQRHIQLIAKIEDWSGVQNIENILSVAGGVMVARGDLGVEIPPEEVPLIQKKLIKKCNRWGKPVITATHMLDSMERNPIPTRAEISDVANAIFDGTDAIMLSGESAMGKYPVEAVKTMARLALRTERALNYRDILLQKQADLSRTITDAISHATCTIAMDLEADAILTPTASGFTARKVSKYRPLAPIIALSPNRDTVLHLSLVWGVHPMEVPFMQGTDAMLDIGVKAAREKGIIKRGDLVILTAGIPMGTPGTTNLLKVHLVN